MTTRKTILLVEDDDAYADLLTAHLAHVAVLRANSESSLRRIWHQAFDIAIFDRQLGRAKKTGVELAIELRQRWNGPILVNTDFPLDEEERAQLHARHEILACGKGIEMEVTRVHLGSLFGDDYIRDRPRALRGRPWHKLSTRQCAAVLSRCAKYRFPASLTRLVGAMLLGEPDVQREVLGIEESSRQSLLSRGRAKLAEERKRQQKRKAKGRAMESVPKTPHELAGEIKQAIEAFVTDDRATLLGRLRELERGLKLAERACRESETALLDKSADLRRAEAIIDVLESERASPTVTPPSGLPRRKHDEELH